MAIFVDITPVGEATGETVSDSSKQITKIQRRTRRTPAPVTQTNRFASVAGGGLVGKPGSKQLTYHLRKRVTTQWNHSFGVLHQIVWSAAPDAMLFVVLIELRL